MNPRVSVLMPVYNAEAFLAEAIESILHQSFTDFEFIIINDGSTDHSEQIICGYQDSRIKYLKNERNIGLIRSLNKGIDMAKGEYVARMDADDISLPSRLEKQVNYMDEHPEVVVCGTAYEYFGDSSKIQWPLADFKKSFTHLASGPPIGHPTAMIRSKVLRDGTIKYEEKFQYAADYAFWIRLSQKGYIGSLPEVLLLYRWHENNMSKYDPSQVEARTAARALWYEILLKRSLTNNELQFLGGNDTQWATLMNGLQLIELVINVDNIPLLDKQYYGKQVIAKWEHQMIFSYPIRGFFFCTTRYKTRTWSSASFLGLCYWFISSIVRKPGTRKSH